MKKTLFLALTVLGFCSYDAQAGIIFKKKCKSCSSCNNTQTVGSTTSKTQNASAPSKKVEAPSPVKAQDAGKGAAPAPVKAPKKVAAPAQ